MELSDLALEIEDYLISKGLETSKTTVSELIEMLYNEVSE